MDYKTIVIDYNKKTTEVVIGDCGSEYVGNATCSDREVFDEKIGLKVATARAELPYNVNLLKELVENLLDGKENELVGSELETIDEVAKRLRLNIKHITDETRGIRRNNR